MKTLVTILLSALFLWSPSLSAKYCKTGSSDGMILCRFTDKTGRPHDATIAISYTKQGWSLMIALFLEEFIMLEGDAKIQMGGGELQNLTYIKTHRDLTGGNELMEAAVFQVSEEMLLEMKEAGGTIKFYLPAKDTEVQEIKFKAARFNNLDKLIVETKEVLGL